MKKSPKEQSVQPCYHLMTGIGERFSDKSLCEMLLLHHLAAQLYTWDLAVVAAIAA